MKIQDLQNGDLIFVSSQSDIAEAIQRSTGWYNHVAIFFAGWIYHATSKRGVIKEPIDQFLQVDECYAVYACSDIDVKAVWKRAEQHLYKPYNNSFIQIRQAFIVLNILQKSSPFLKPFLCSSVMKRGNSSFLAAVLQRVRFSSSSSSARNQS